MEAATLMWLLDAGSSACVGLSVAVASHQFMSLDPLPMLATGPRAQARRQALSDARPGVDAVLRRLCRLVAPWIGTATRRAIETRLDVAGDYLGLHADDVVTLSALSAVVLGGVGAGLEASAAWGLAGAALGAAIWPARIAAVGQQRVRSADRELPAAIDLIAMCMDAGVDFGRSVRLVATSDARGVLGPEFERMLHEIALGSPRRQALEALGRRLPAIAMQDFVAAAVQADRTGTPLSDVLAAQATTARLRRSVAAEEAAARAGVLMMLPLMLLLVCIVLLLVGPFAVSGGLAR